MRVNIYTEELTNDIQRVFKKDGDRIFYGMRFYLKSPSELHHTENDDDRSAVTFWGKPAKLEHLFRGAVTELIEDSIE